MVKCNLAVMPEEDNQAKTFEPSNGLNIFAGTALIFFHVWQPTRSILIDFTNCVLGSPKHFTARHSFTFYRRWENQGPV